MNNINQKLIEIRLSAYDSRLLNNGVKFFISTCKKFTPVNLAFFPVKTSKFTVIRGPHIDKRSREQFQIIKYSAFFQISEKVLENNIQPIVKNLPAGVHFRIKVLL